ncbi:MAG: hypothetical protein BWX71_02500 [Deltaproteobacteria bacterium ADurb.Bin072]|nr:MAG: hypothetical protein BWX71_02500 [Deltaproteobacteria bacterium ADurb.Bin072]
MALSTSVENQPSMLLLRKTTLAKNSTAVGMMVRVTKATTSFVLSLVPSTPLLRSSMSFTTLRVTRKTTRMSRMTFRLMIVKITALLEGTRPRLPRLALAMLMRIITRRMAATTIISLVFLDIVPIPASFRR